MSGWRRALAWAISLIPLATVGCAARGGQANLRPARAQSESATLLARRCGDCHAVPRPASMSRSEWLDSLTRMRRRMRLPESEWDSLTAMAPADEDTTGGQGKR